MEPERRKEPLVSSFSTGRWDIVRWGRWAGVFILISALALALWGTLETAVITAQSGEVYLHRLVHLFLGSLVQIGSWGVVILLLAELVDRVSVSEADDLEPE